MLERYERLLKIACGALAVLVMLQVIRLGAHVNPLRGATIPEVPTWTNKPPAESSGGANVQGPQQPPPVPAGGAGARSANRSARGASRQGGPPTAASGVDVPPEVRRRAEAITESGLLGPVIRPPPMALLGIAGKDVMLRAPNGQSGLIQEGGELGGVKLLRIGTNRVLVLENGQEKELTIFGGLGGESLLRKPNQGNP